MNYLKNLDKNLEEKKMLRGFALDTLKGNDLSVGAELKLLEFYPRGWQVCFHRTSHPWVLHMTLWHYWLWYTFIVGLVFYIIFMYKTISYNRADIKGKRATGEKRRLAWSELLICLIPLFWSINIISNAFMYLRVVESTGGYVFLSLQVTGYQWGWKYYYGDTTYLRSHYYPVKVGLKYLHAFSANKNIVNEARLVSSQTILKSNLSDFEKKLFTIIKYSSFNLSVAKDSDFFKERISLQHIIRFFVNEVNYDFNRLYNTMGIGIKGDVYFCRFLLKQTKTIDDSYDEIVKNQRFQPGYKVTSQGLDANSLVTLKFNKKQKLVTHDYLRLFRTTGSAVLPTRVCVRIMSTSEDITHSWAVPGLGIKVDCVPGRLFCVLTNIWREGVYFGQCSELCGWNHYNMPISVYALSYNHFILWWEVEIHDLFNKASFLKEKINSRDYLINMHLFQYTNECNYLLLNWKAK